MTVIVIFGAAVLKGGRPSRTLQARVEAAFRCGGPGARYIATGAVGRNPPSEARVMAALLAGLGVPAAQVRLEETATDTFTSAVACARMLAGEAGPVRLASSGYHLPRCLMLMRLAGVRATGCKPPPPPRWAWYWRGRETLAIPYDLLQIGLRTIGLRP